MTHLEYMQAMESGAEDVRVMVSHEAAIWKAFNTRIPYSDTLARRTYNVEVVR